jgi:hypothetical protein
MSQNSKNQGFSYISLLLDGRIRICTNQDGSGRPKKYGSYGSGSTRLKKTCLHDNRYARRKVLCLKHLQFARLTLPKYKKLMETFQISWCKKVLNSMLSLI